jgi:hypothetical protein
VGRLVGAGRTNTDVIGLLLAELGELDAKGGEVKAGDLLVEVLGEHVHLAGLVLLLVVSVDPQLDLGKGLVGEGGGHHERRVAGGAAQVEQAALSKHDDTVAVGEDELVHLGLDVAAGGDLHQALHVQLVVEVADVADDGVVLHLGHVGGHDDVLVTGGGDEDISLGHNGGESHDGEALHGGLQGADRINLGDVHDGTGSLHGLGATLSDITETADDGALAGNHDIGGAAQTIGQGVLAAVQVIELGLSHGVVDVDGREQELLLLGHDIKSVDTGGGLLRDTDHAGSKSGPLGGVLGQLAGNEGKDDLELGVGGGGRIGEGLVLGVLLLGLHTLVDEESHVSTIVHDEVAAVTLLVNGPGDGVQGALPVLLKGLTLPGEHSGRSIAGDGGSGVVLGGEDVATAPSHLSTHSLKGLDQHSSLDGHVQGARDSGTSEQVRTILSSAGHKSGHLLEKLRDECKYQMMQR